MTMVPDVQAWHWIAIAVGWAAWIGFLAWMHIRQNAKNPVDTPSP